MTKPEISNIEVVFGIARKEMARDKAAIKELLVLEDKLLKFIEDASKETDGKGDIKG